MPNDNNHRRKRRSTKTNTKRSSRKVSKVKADTNVRRVSRNVKPISRDIAEREDVREPQSLLRRIETYIGFAVERIRKSLQLRYNVRTYEVTYDEILYCPRIYGYAENKLIERGFDMTRPINRKDNDCTLSIIFYQTTKETRMDFIRRKIIDTWRWFLSH